MLRLEKVSVEVEGRRILEGIDLEIRPGETHILFGPNGSGKSTLLATIMGFTGYRVVEGHIYFQDQEITHLPVAERARMGLGILFQRPPTVRGITTRQMVEICSQGRGEVEELARQLNLTDFLDRDINYGFSGGEIKRAELLQLLAQDPSVVLLDEPESGVDLENIALIGQAINRLLQKEIIYEEGRSQREIRRDRKKSGLIITHTGYILNYVHADAGHVLYRGHLSCMGNPQELLACIRQMGYEECVRCVV